MVYLCQMVAVGGSLTRTKKTTQLFIGDVILAEVNFGMAVALALAKKRRRRIPPRVSPWSPAQRL